MDRQKLRNKINSIYSLTLKTLRKYVSKRKIAKRLD